MKTDAPVTMPGGQADRTQRWARAMFWTAWLAGILLVVVGGRMLWGHPENRAEVLLLPPDLAAAREQLLLDPRDEALLERIRELDLTLRQRYFRHLDANAQGAWLLLGAGVILVLALRELASARRRLPMPRVGDDHDPRRGARDARWAVAGVAAAVALAFVVVSAANRSHLHLAGVGLETLPDAVPLESVPDPGPALEEWLANWPMFRGPRGDGVAITTTAPLDWDVESGRGVIWKAPVPAPGFSSPIVWGDRLFLTGGTRESRQVLCYDANQGTLLWNQSLPPLRGPHREPPELPEYTGYAASTPATDGRRVYAIFGTGELVAYDFNGTLVWNKMLGPLENTYGHAASLVFWRDLLLVQLDQSDGTDGKSRLYALDGATGQVRWEQPRAVPASWATPLVWEVAGEPQVITLSEPWVIGYDAVSGTEVWRLDCLGPDVAPMPVVVGDLVVVASPHNHVSGLRLDGRGDVTTTHHVWQHDEFVPDVTSPVSDGERLYLLLTFGDLVCVDGATGAKVWDHFVEGEFNASPTLVGNRVYIVSAEGQTLVVEAGDTYQELARSELGEAVRASPAMVDGRIYMRAEQNLYCLGASPVVSMTNP